MDRDHKKLRVFRLAHQLVLDVYRATTDMPKDEWYGLRSQIRRAAVSVPTNIVEGRARRTQKEFVQFLGISLGSATELRYLLELSGDLSLLGVNATEAPRLIADADTIVRAVAGLIRTIQAEGSSTTEEPADGGIG
jgi:four helix bundle protein